MATATLKIDIWTAGRKKLPSDNYDLSLALQPHVEHVAEMCAQGYHSGEIVDDNFSGWWTIDRS